MIFELTKPGSNKAIGKMHATLGKALKAGERNARRLGSEILVKHWKGYVRATVHVDGTRTDHGRPL